MSPDSRIPRVVVVGGANTDVVGRSVAHLIEHDSNPGHVRVSSGGVGRNIAENLARLGLAVELVTALGGDHNAKALAQACRENGIGVSHAVVASELPGSLYLAILDETGDMAVAMNDMRALDLLTASALAQREAVFSAADVVVADANLSAEALEWLATHMKVPIVLDPVSAAKAGRVRGVVSRLAALKCNALEAGALLGDDEPKGPDELAHAARRLVEMGARRVFLTAGPGGTYYASVSEGDGFVPAPRVEIANATGAGDAFSAGVAAGIAEGMNVAECAVRGTALAGFALRSDMTVSVDVSRDAVRRAIEEMAS